MASTTILALITVCLVAAVAANDASRINYTNYSVIQIRPWNERHIKILSTLRNLDLWTDPRAASIPVLTHISPEKTSQLLQTLRFNGIDHEIVSNDLQQLIDSQSLSKRAVDSCENPNYEIYHDYEDLICIYSKLAEKSSGRMKMETIGKSLKGVDMYKLMISTDGKAKPEVMFECGIHAREWISPATCLWMVKEMVRKSPSWLNKFNVVLIPVVNVDGYKITRTTNRMQRKNARDTGCGSKNGVDLNRNFDAHYYDEGGSSVSPCSETYRGENPFSEPETQVVRDVVLSLKNPAAYFSVHSYSQLWLYPYGFNHDLAPNNDELKKLATIGTDTIKKASGVKYKPIQSSDLYPTSGASDDWAYIGGNISRVFTIELRPGEDDDAVGFLLPTDQIKPTGEEFAAAINAVVEEIGKSYS